MSTASGWAAAASNDILLEGSANGPSGEEEVVATATHSHPPHPPLPPPHPPLVVAQYPGGEGGPRRQDHPGHAWVALGMWKNPRGAVCSLCSVGGRWPLYAHPHPPHARPWHPVHPSTPSPALCRRPAGGGRRAPARGGGAAWACPCSPLTHPDERPLLDDTATHPNPTPPHPMHSPIHLHRHGHRVVA